MPRTKVAKNNKRHRNDSIREEQLRAFQIKMDAFEMNVEELGSNYIAQVDTKLKLIMSAMSTKLLKMKMSDFFQLQLFSMTDFKSVNETTINKSLSAQSFSNKSSATMDKDLIRNDDGYITEDSATGGRSLSVASNSQLNAHGELLQPLPSPRAMRPLGPLHSARARRVLRSRSACDEAVVPSSAKAKSTLTQPHAEHASRSKLRTPIASRTKAFSTERTPSKTTRCDRDLSPSTPPFQFLRWPKPGEIVLSKCGTPMMTQVMPDSSANVNIPIKDGMLSLRPRKLDGLKPTFIDKLDTNTLQEIKTLHENLNLIMSMAEKAALK